VPYLWNPYPVGTIIEQSMADLGPCRAHDRPIEEVKVSPCQVVGQIRHLSPFAAGSWTDVQNGERLKSKGLNFFVKKNFIRHKKTVEKILHHL